MVSKTSKKSSVKKPVSKPAGNQEIIIAAIIIVVVIAIIALMVFQPQIFPKQDINETKDCTEIVYYETITIPAKTEVNTPYDYEITYEWEGIPSDNYSTYNPNNFYARQTREIKNLEQEKGIFMVTCSFTTQEDGTVNISNENTVLPDKKSVFTLNYKITPGEEVTYGGCVITPPEKTVFSDTETTEQIRKTRLPEGC